MTVFSKDEPNSSVMTILAKALYDNLADAPDELSFRKGDIVTVIEQDVDGLVGWWLCLLHGRQGIVPGNRLQIIPAYDVDHGSLAKEQFGNYGGHGFPVDRKDRDIDYDTLPTPVKASHGEIYDSPGPLSVKDLYNIPLQQNNDLANKFNQLKFSSPKSVAEETANVATNSSRSHAGVPALELYDSLPNKSLHDQSDYDIPVAKPSPNSQGFLPEGIYDTFPQPVGRPLSPRLLLSEDIYKIPSAFHEIKATSPDVKSSVGYNVPRKDGTPHYKQPNSIALNNSDQDAKGHPAQEEIYVAPTHKYNGVSHNEDIYNVPQHQREIYDVLPPVGFRNESEKPAVKQNNTPLPGHLSPIMAKRDSQPSHASPPGQRRITGNHDAVINNNSLTSTSQYTEEDYMDYQDIYGAEPPPGMTKSPMSSRSASPTQQPKETKRSVLEQINMDAVKALNITQLSAFDRLGKLHLASDTAVTTLLGFTEGNWLEPQELKTNIASIRDLANKCKTALRLLTEFGLGCLVNVRQRQGVTTLEEKIVVGLEPLLECYYKIKICLLHLDGLDWVVPPYRAQSTEKFFATINAIMILSQRIPDMCDTFARTVHLHVGSLFDRELPEESRPDVGAIPMSPDITPPTPALFKALTDGTPTFPAVAEQQNTARAPDERRLSHSSPEEIGGVLTPTMLKQRFESRKKSMERAASQTLKPRCPPKPALPDQRKSMCNYMTLPGRPSDLTIAATDEGLVTEYVPESPRRKCSSDPLSSPSAQEADKTMWGGSCPSLERNKSNPNSVDDATAIAHVQHAGSEASGMNAESAALAGKQASDPNLLASSPQGALQLRSSSLPHDGRKAVFPSYQKEQSNTIGKTEATRVPRLDHRDIETLDFFCRQVESQVIILREAVRSLTESVENLEPPKKFVSHSKFVILTAHKVVHAGDESSERIMNQYVKKQLKQCIHDLTASIRSVVASTKQAAVQYPNRACLSEMASTILNVGECVRGLHIEIRKALEM